MSYKSNAARKIALIAFWGLFFLASSLLHPASSHAQSPVNVTATVKDSAGIPYSNATVSILLIPTGTAPTVGGAQINGTNNGQLDVNGKLNVSLYKNTDIVPASSQWQFTICETPGIAPPLGTGGQCFTSSQTVSAAVDFSTQFQAAAKSLSTVTLGAGSVTHTAGALTLNNFIFGNGAADIKDSTFSVVPVANGGTGLATQTSNVIYKGNGTGVEQPSCWTDNGTTSACTEPITTTGSVSTGSGASAAGATATGGIACVEGANTGWTPTVGQDYQRCDSTAHAFVCSNNGAAEAACSPAPVFPVTVSGTVNSGGVPYFSSTTVESSSAALGANALVVGGGAGAAPATGSGDCTYVTHTLACGTGTIFDLTPAGAFYLPNNSCAGGAGGKTLIGGDNADAGEVCAVLGGGAIARLAVATSGGGNTTTCTNKVITVISSIAAPTCSLLSAFVTSDYTNATTTLSNVTGLAVTLAASTNYAVSCKLIYQGSASTASMILSSTGPASPTKVSAQNTQTTTVGAGAAMYSAASDGTTFGFTLGPTAIISTATDLPSTVDIGIINGVNAGTFQLQAKANGAGTVTIRAGSFCTFQ